MSFAVEGDLANTYEDLPKAPRRGFLMREAGILLLLAMNLVFGATHASDYGQSWDDPGDAAYGRVAMRAYVGSREYLQTGDRKYYGPLYFMVSSGLTQAVHSAVPEWNPVDVRHFLNFVTFQMAILAFYALARRLLAIGPALVATLLFASQPVLFGHAFINQKDIPFLAAFLAAMALGLRVTDGLKASRNRTAPTVGTPRTHRQYPPSCAGGRACMSDSGLSSCF